MKFRLIGGNHTEGNGPTRKVFKKNAIIDSDRDLTKLFRGKFERIYTAEQLEAVAPVPKVAEKPTPAPTPVAEPAPAVSEPTTEEKKPEASKESRKPRKRRGRDATKSFPLALEEEFLVFQRGSRFDVYEPEDDAPLNEKGLKKAEVESYIKEYLGG